ncbi:MAG: 50S ribosomal protein L15 [Candidatus Izemoplasmatales bacterium]|nr:50S ribosomal protein L15 [Candidatus Izemoplasmatales bacterium]MDD4988027.1 50S ribosomal protein L15 [Candidatus Izemoplasmatales bacterium]MDY0372784.1 50S ribosomal protein L15 [Candidatus Izemoplasmatales bacterium]NLF48967.1 50S ribosomal protein L15 [Acholeplasmataceae bacterium]
MKLNELKPVEGATHYKKRVGRGSGSGTGKTAGRGHNGQNSRTGGGTRLGFEGGQTPLFKRLPKRGFTNYFRKEFAIINLSDLNQYDNDAVITPESLLDEGRISDLKAGLKVLGSGKLEKRLTVKAHKFSASAEEAIAAAGGKTEVI